MIKWITENQFSTFFFFQNSLLNASYNIKYTSHPIILVKSVPEKVRVRQVGYDVKLD